MAGAGVVDCSLRALGRPLQRHRAAFRDPRRDLALRLHPAPGCRQGTAGLRAEFAGTVAAAGGAGARLLPGRGRADRSDRPGRLPRDLRPRQPTRRHRPTGRRHKPQLPDPPRRRNLAVARIRPGAAHHPFLLGAAGRGDALGHVPDPGAAYGSTVGADWDGAGRLHPAVHLHQRGCQQRQCHQRAGRARAVAAGGAGRDAAGTEILPEGSWIRVGARLSVGSGVVVEVERPGVGRPDRTDPAAVRVARA